MAPVDAQRVGICIASVGRILGRHPRFLACLDLGAAIEDAPSGVQDSRLHYAMRAACTRPLQLDPYLVEFSSRRCCEDRAHLGNLLLLEAALLVGPQVGFALPEGDADAFVGGGIR